MILKYTYIQWLLISAECGLDKTSEEIDGIVKAAEDASTDELPDDYEISAEVSGEDILEDIKNTVIGLNSECAGYCEGCKSCHEG